MAFSAETCYTDPDKEFKGAQLMKMERGYPIYTVTPKAEAAILRGHPWVYDAEILNTEGETGNGGLVDVVSKKGRCCIWIRKT